MAEALTPHFHGLQDAKPLLDQSIKLVEEITPLLRELREGGLVSNIEALTSTAAAAAADIQKLQVCWGGLVWWLEGSWQY